MMKNINQYLKWAGWILVALGVLGYAIKDSWAPAWDLSANENLAHVVIGLVTLAIVYWANNTDLRKWYTVLLGVVGIYLAAYGWFVADETGNFYGYTTLETLDNVVHLVLGAWALWAVWGGKKK